MTHSHDRRREVSPRSTPRSNARAALRAAGCLGVVGLLSACAGGQQISATQEASQYESRAHHSYTPPGSRNDPWGPYIHEASEKYDVPERWIREVMRVESGGRTEMNGIPITSGAGAMGLMQVMPATYDELRGRYPLGDDPYDPHNSILAGTAYIRELYDLYGNPGFLAAYNGGPGRLDDYLTRNRPLPEETRRYVAKIGPYITDSFPTKRSTAEMYALNSLPTSIPAGPRYTAPADAPYTPPKAVDQPPVEVAFAPPSSTDGAFDPPPGWTPKTMPRAERNAYVPPPASLPPTPAPATPAPSMVAMADPLPPRFEAAPMPAREPDAFPVTAPPAAYDPPPVRHAAAPLPAPPRRLRRCRVRPSTPPCRSRRASRRPCRPSRRRPPMVTCPRASLPIMNRASGWFPPLSPRRPRRIAARPASGRSKWVRSATRVWPRSLSAPRGSKQVPSCPVPTRRWPACTSRTVRSTARG